MSIQYLSVCVRACVGARARGCLHACIALLNQHSTLMRHILLSFVASLAPHFFTLYHKRHDFLKKKSY